MVGASLDTVSVILTVYSSFSVLRPEIFSEYSENCSAMSNASNAMSMRKDLIAAFHDNAFGIDLKITGWIQDLVKGCGLYEWKWNVCVARDFHQSALKIKKV